MRLSLHLRLSFRGVLFAALLTGCTVSPPAAPVQVWEPARWKQTTLAAKQALERGETAEAERICVAALQSVSASTVRTLDEYASLLGTLKRAEAEGARARSDMLREARLRPGSSIVYLGFVPSGELRAYATLLRELARTADAEVVTALADAEDHARGIHLVRLQMQYQGRNPHGVC